jgi:hypothetical protein
MEFGHEREQDYANLRYYYVFLIWPCACTDPSANDMLREVQISESGR